MAISFKHMVGSDWHKQKEADEFIVSNPQNFSKEQWQEARDRLQALNPYVIDTTSGYTTTYEPTKTQYAVYPVIAHWTGQLICMFAGGASLAAAHNFCELINTSPEWLGEHVFEGLNKLLETTYLK